MMSGCAEIHFSAESGTEFLCDFFATFFVQPSPALRFSFTAGQHLRGPAAFLVIASVYQALLSVRAAE